MGKDGIAYFHLPEDMWVAIYEDKYLVEFGDSEGVGNRVRVLLSHDAAQALSSRLIDTLSVREDTDGQ